MTTKWKCGFSSKEDEVEVWELIWFLALVSIIAGLASIIWRLIRGEKGTEKFSDIKVPELHFECYCEHSEFLHGKSRLGFTICCIVGCPCKYDAIPQDQIVDSDPD